jgi:hypothetical protein
LAKKGGGSWDTLGKTSFLVVFKGKIIFKKKKEYPQDPLYQKSSNLDRSFLLKFKNEFHIMPWPPGMGWAHNKENYFCR